MFGRVNSSFNIVLVHTPYNISSFEHFDLSENVHWLVVVIKVGLLFALVTLSFFIPTLLLLLMSAFVFIAF